MAMSATELEAYILKAFPDARSRLMIWQEMGITIPVQL